MILRASQVHAQAPNFGNKLQVFVRLLSRHDVACTCCITTVTKRLPYHLPSKSLSSPFSLSLIQHVRPLKIWPFIVVDVTVMAAYPSDLPRLYELPEISPSFLSMDVNVSSSPYLSTSFRTLAETFPQWSLSTKKRSISIRLSTSISYPTSSP